MAVHKPHWICNVHPKVFRSQGLLEKPFWSKTSRNGGKIGILVPFCQFRMFFLSFRLFWCWSVEVWRIFWQTIAKLTFSVGKQLETWKFSPDTRPDTPPTRPRHAPDTPPTRPDTPPTRPRHAPDTPPTHPRHTLSHFYPIPLFLL